MATETLRHGFAGHGNAGEEGAFSVDEAAPAGTFRARHRADGAFEFDFVSQLSAFLGRPDLPDAERLELSRVRTRLETWSLRPTA